jgi:tetratricopeptide (TPR) repeat protein
MDRVVEIALQHHRAGRVSEAEVLYEWILELQPTHRDALHLRGFAAFQQGKHELALEHISQAIGVDPDEPTFHNHLGLVLMATGKLEPAVESLQRAVALKRDYAEAYNNLGVALRKQGRLDEAIVEFRQAVALEPGSAGAHSNLGGALRDQGRLDEAIASFQHAVALKPDHHEGHLNLGNSLNDQGSPDEAAESFARALALQPDDADAHFGAALVRLVQGDLERGFAEYEWRWRCPSFAGGQRALPAGAMWNGGPLDGRTILLHAEQGLGDTLQFARYAPLVATRGGRVVLEVQPELLPLLRGLPGVEQLVARGERLPSFEVHAPLLSLPHLLGTRLATIPAEVPYVRADPTSTAAWAKYLSAGDAGAGLRVGLVWAGNQDHKRDSSRSVPLAVLAQLGAVPGVRPLALQKGPAAAQAETWPAGLQLINLGPLLADFGDTASVIENLDLVISVDTSVAHLSGALARPVWVLLPFVSDWRWLREREDSPWYPTARLFRQPAPGDWDSVVARVADALRELAAAHNPGTALKPARATGGRNGANPASLLVGQPSDEPARHRLPGRPQRLRRADAYDAGAGSGPSSARLCDCGG